MEQWLQQAEHLWVGGHRGCRCEYPENSIEAMKEGIKRGADYLEIDVQLTRDKVPVIIHDTCLKYGDLQGYVHEYNFCQLKYGIPGLCTLEEALCWGSEAQVRFGLEIKTIPYEMQEQNKMLMEQIPSLLHKYKMIQNVFVFGQDYQILHYLKAIDKQIPIGLIVPFVPADPVRLMQEMGACIYLSYVYNMTPAMVKELQENGYYVDGAILNDRHWTELARELGINMFETDFPEREMERSVVQHPEKLVRSD